MDENTILDYNLDDVVEPRTAPADSEQELRIVDVRIDTDKNGYPYMMPRFELVEDPYAKEFSDFLRLPHEEQTAKEANHTKFRLKNFYEAFGVDYSRGVTPEDLKGKTGWAILGLRESNLNGEDENHIRRYVIPR